MEHARRGWRVRHDGLAGARRHAASRGGLGRRRKRPRITQATPIMRTNVSELITTIRVYSSSLDGLNFSDIWPRATCRLIAEIGRSPAQPTLGSSGVVPRTRITNQRIDRPYAYESVRHSG